MQTLYVAPALEKPSRLTLIDSLRGFALLGIIIANIPFANDLTHVYNENRYFIGSKETDHILHLIVSFFIDKKFITIFSILFGFGFSVLLKKHSNNASPFDKYFIRRMLLLFIIGCLHAYVLWFGDIIRDYAICGLLLLLVYRWPSNRLFWLAIAFAGPLTAIIFILNGVLNLQEYSYDHSLVKEIYTTESYRRYLYANFTIDPFVNFVQDSPLTLISCFGKVVLGYWLGQIGFFQHPQNFRKMMNSWIILGLTVGIASSVGYWAITTGRLELSLPRIWIVFIIAGGLVLQSLLYIAVFIKLFQKSSLQKLFLVFEPVGKMALTNYIMQTVFCLMLFYNWTNGLQLYRKITLTETYLIAMAIFLLQVLYSRWWLSRFSQGPIEMIWRKLAYSSKTEQKNISVHL